MYYITGDCHGNFEKIYQFCKFNKTSKKDVIIILGDVGLNFYLNRSDEKRKKKVSELPMTFFCIHGNHEERPFHIDTYQEMEWHGGVVYYEPQYSNLLFAKDGEIYDLDGKKAIVIGGAYSVDKWYRMQRNLPWFPDEQPSAEIRDHVEKQLVKCNWMVDYVFSHTCPKYMMPTDLFLKNVDQSKVDNSTEEWLEALCKKMNFGKWYFAHFHDNRSVGDFIMLFEEIRELGRDDFLQCIGRPKYQYGQDVLFYIDVDGERVECQGRIEIVDGMGTLEQSREVSYDIMGPDFRNPDQKMLYKHVVESKVERLVEPAL